MKTDTIILFILPIIIFFSSHCKKNSNESICNTFDSDFNLLVIKPTEPFASGTKKIDGLGEQIWQFNTSTIYLNGFDELTFICSAYNDTLFFYEREQIVFNNLSLNEHRVELPNDDYTNGFARYQRLIADGDVVDAQWQIIDDSGSYVEFTKIDTLNRKISGHFEVHFLRDTVIQLDGIHSYSDKISFIDVDFEVGY